MRKVPKVALRLAPICFGLMITAGASAQNNLPTRAKGATENVREVSLLGPAEKQGRENLERTQPKTGEDAEPRQEGSSQKSPAPPPSTPDATFEVSRLTTTPPDTPPASGEAGGAEPASTASKAPRATPSIPAEALPESYQIGAGDVLRVDVWDEPKASVGAVVVRPDGRIGMPLIKEVAVMGLTPSQAERVITERLSAMIPGADVTVVVTGINSKIYVIGGVKREGPVPYTYRMTILQALSEAGGLSDYAKRRKIYVLRTLNGKETRFPFDYDAAVKGEKAQLNITLLPTDTIVIPR